MKGELTKSEIEQLIKTKGKIIKGKKIVTK